MAKPVPKRSVPKILSEISTKSGQRPSEVFRSFVLVYACALSLGLREQAYLDEIKRWDSDCVNLFAAAGGALVDEMEEKPFQDCLGPIYMEVSALGDLQHKGAFYTPYPLCRMCAEMTMRREWNEDRPLFLDEPACGSAGMVLAAAEVLKDRGIPPSRLRVSCTDVDLTACNMAYINLVLWGIPATVTHGNALSLKVWHKWQTPAFLKFASYLLGGTNPVAEVPEEPIKVGITATGQIFFDWEAA